MSDHTDQDTDKTLYIGLMSGTSMDALDAALVCFDHGIPDILATRSQPIPQDLKQRLIDVCHNRHDHLDECARLDSDFGRFQAEVVARLLLDNGIKPGRISAIGSHGQTVRHLPGGNPPYSIQVGDPATLAVLTGIDVVADFRRQDIAAGGQGAPLVPAFHAAFWRDSAENRAILNLGGISNITILPRNPHEPVSGMDCGPANTLLDAWIGKKLGLTLDQGGQWAAQGQVQPTLLKQLLSDPYFLRPPPKSTGTEYFNLAWLERKISACNALERHQGYHATDVQATLCALTISSVTQAIQQYAPDTQAVYVCGGGSHNHYLMQALAQSLATALGTIPLQTTAALGMDPRWVEATAFAWLARENLNGRPGNLPSVTGAKQALILGGLYRGQPIKR